MARKQIASDFGTVVQTIKVYRGRMMKKMKVRSIAELVHLAATVGVSIAAQAPKHLSLVKIRRCQVSEEARYSKNAKTNQAGKSRGKILGTLFAATLAATSLSPFVRSPVSAQQNAAKPNILVIFGDDVGQSNISAYTRGLMGYKTPNIDRVK